MTFQRHGLLLSRTAFAAVALTLVCAVPAGTADVPGEVRFNRDIGPILSENCFACHGPDGHQRKAELRLDTKDGIFGKAKHGVAVVPGDLAKSELVARVTNADPDEVMPPSKTGKKLSAHQIELLRQW